jgi:molecular chaperone DnaK
VSYGLGVDLGTSFTGVATGRHGRTRIVSLSDDPISVASLLAVRPPGSLLVREIDETVPVVLGGRPYPAVAVLAEALRSALAAVTTSEGEPPDQVVLTCPAVWGPARRQQFGEVSRRAGLTSVTVVSEPEAAVTALVEGRRLAQDDVVLVYDIGGVTVDMAVVRVADSGMEILGLPEGADGAGGADFDDLILAHVDRAVGGALSELDLSDPVAVGVLTGVRAECVRAKEALSRSDVATVRVVGLAEVVGLSQELDPIQLNRADFETLIRKPLTSTLAGLRRVLDSAGVQAPDLTAVVLVGGSSRIPLVSRMLSKSVGRPLLTDSNPQHCVALGAAAIADGASTIADGARRITPGAPPITDSIPTIAAAAAKLAAAKPADGKPAGKAAKSAAKGRAAEGKAAKGKAAKGKVAAGRADRTGAKPAGGRPAAALIAEPASTPDPKPAPNQAPTADEMLAATFPGGAASPAATTAPVDVTTLPRRAGGHRMPRMVDWRWRAGPERHGVEDRRWRVIGVSAVVALLIGGGTYAFSPLGTDGDVNSQVVDSSFDPDPTVTDLLAITDTPDPTAPPTASATSAPARTRAPGRKTVVRPTTARSTPTPTRSRAKANTGVLVGVGGRCLDVIDGKDEDGTNVQIFTCNTSSAQLWTVGSDGTLRARGKCLQIVDIGARQRHLQIFGCNRSDFQRWTVQSGRIFNPASSQCLDVLGNQSYDGTPVVMDDCDGDSGQRWALQS